MARRILDLIYAVIDGQVTEDSARREISVLSDELIEGIAQWVAGAVFRIYGAGVEEAGGDPVARSEPGEAWQEAAEESLTRRLAETVVSVRRDADDALLTIRKRRIEAVIRGAGPRDEASAMREEMEERGVAFTDRRGRRWDPRAYAETVLFTEAADIQNAGHLNTAAEIGSPAVAVTDGGPGDVDEPCQTANGQVWSIPYAMAHKLEHPRCFPAGTVVSGPRASASTARWFDGEVVEIRTQGGRFLSVTPNHPILTAEGWVAAGSLVEGGHVIGAPGREGGETAVVPDDHQIPAFIEDVAGAVGRADGMAPRVVPTAPEDFHGDGEGSEVCVIRTDGLLRNGLDADGSEVALQQPLGGRYVELFAFDRRGAFPLLIERRGTTTRGPVRGFGDSRSLLWRSPGHPRRHRFGPISQVMAGFRDEALNDAPAAYAKLAREGLSRLAREVARDHAASQDVITSPLPRGADSPGFRARSQQPALLERRPEPWLAHARELCGGLDAHAGQVVADRVIEIRRRAFSGHVFNLQTERGWYVANDVIVHNCRRSFAAKPSTWTGTIDRR